MKTIDYDTNATGNTETHIATDGKMKRKFGSLERAYEEGFASESGVRNETAESSGRVLHPETEDESHPHAHSSVDAENAGLADS